MKFLGKAGILIRGLRSTGRTEHQITSIQQGHKERTGEKNARMTEKLYGYREGRWPSLQARAD